MLAALPGLPVAGNPLGSPKPPVCTCSRGLRRLGIAELPMAGCWIAGLKATSGASGFGVSRCAVAGLATGEAKTGDMIFGFGGVIGSGTIFLATRIGFGFTANFCWSFTGCGFHCLTGGAALGV